MNSFAAITLIAASAVTAPNAAAILARVQESSAHAAIKQLVYSHEWGAVLQNISSGKPEWISLGVALEPGSDASFGADLHDAMFHALTNNAALVLQQAGPAFGISDLCRGRHDPLETFASAMAEQQAAKRAVASISAETKNREACLAALKAGEADLRHFFEATPK